MQQRNSGPSALMQTYQNKSGKGRILKEKQTKSLAVSSLKVHLPPFITSPIRWICYDSMSAFTRSLETLVSFILPNTAIQFFYYFVWLAVENKDLLTLFLVMHLTIIRLHMRVCDRDSVYLSHYFGTNGRNIIKVKCLWFSG